MVAPFRYPAVIWAALIGVVLWGDVPDVWIIGGCIVVVGSGLYIFYRETTYPARVSGSNRVQMVKPRDERAGGENDDRY